MRTTEGSSTEEGTHLLKAPRARAGDTMSCEVDFRNNTVIFCRNDAVVYRSPALRIPQGGFHAAVGLHSHGESICLLEMEPWRSASDQYLPPPVQEQYHYSVCRDAVLNQARGILSYNGGDAVPVALLLSKCPLAPDVNSFSIEIVDQGRGCYIAIGLCPQHYRRDRQPGWDKHSIAYHADDGGIYSATGAAITSLPIARQGATMTCQFNFSDKTVTFLNNGGKGLSVPTSDSAPWWLLCSCRITLTRGDNQVV
ncbi:SPRY domain-containing protein 3-like isoform X2 [Haliotis rubra]|uniref:SPRY domain-containing protein 3-like isoform X2 n=1 Tax=Haliotis rubra TaxID=36100 RepID=UPI001EE564FC|nr:SPRY domain-containing protein 3-like isoform X2 [Haliotis rubra]